MKFVFSGVLLLNRSPSLNSRVEKLILFYIINQQKYVLR